MKIVVYAYQGCPYSMRAVELCKSLEQRRGYDVKWYLFADRHHPQLLRAAEHYGYSRVPIVVVNGRVLSDGFTELDGLIRR